MKVLHFVTSLKIGGAESALFGYLSKAIQDKADQHFVAYIHHGPNVEKIKELGVPVFKISGLFLSYSPFMFIKFLRLLSLVEPDVVHSSLWSANIIARFVCAIRRIPLICDLHGDSFHEGKLRNILDRLTAYIPQKIVAVSETVKKSYLNNIIKGDFDKKIIVIKNGIDFEWLRAKSLENGPCRLDFGIGEHDFVVGAVGRLEPIKSYDVLIRAFGLFLGEKNTQINNPKLLPKLLIVGWGSKALELQNLAQDLGLQDKVVFVGYRTDCYKFYKLFDCFVLSSKSEGLSMALLEAMALGLPVISTNHGKEHDAIENGVNGFLVESGNTGMLAHAISKLYLDKNLRKKMSIRNTILVENKFSISNVADQYKKLYGQVIKTYF